MHREIKIVALGFFVVTFVASSFVPALGETLYLSCNNNSSATPEIYTIDLTNNMVNNLPAKINETSIDWQEFTSAESSSRSVLNGATNYYHIDRIAGTITLNVTYDFVSQPDQYFNGSPEPCMAISAPATRF